MAKRSARWITGRFFLILCLATLVLAFVPAAAHASAVDSTSPVLHEAEDALLISEGSPNSSQAVASDETGEPAHHEDPVPLTNTRPLSNVNSDSPKSSSTNVMQPIASVQDSALETQSDTSKDDEKAKADSLLKASYDEQLIAFAVYDETSKTLSFHKQTAAPAAGSTFVDSSGESRVAKRVYEGIEDFSPDASVPWAVYDPQHYIEHVVFVDEISPTSLKGWFSGFSSLVTADLAKLDTSRATSVAGLFSACSSLVELDLSNFVTDGVTSFASTFNGCSSLRDLDIHSFNTASAVEMLGMFMGCASLETLDVKHFDVSNVTTFVNMFKGCTSLKTLDLSTWTTSRAEKIGAMFEGCSSLTMLDLSNFDITNVDQIMSRMFSGCAELTTIYVGEKWIVNPSFLRNMAYIFENCGKLVGCMGTALDLTAAASNKDLIRITYAHIDGGPSNPGYLSTHAIPVGMIEVSGMETVTWVNGELVSPKPILTIGGRTLVEGVDYTLSYSEAARYGRHTLTIVGLGDFNGTYTQTYSITHTLNTASPYAPIIWASSWETLARVRSEKPFDTFKELLVDGKVVDASNYVASSGSTIIELTPEYLISLSLGEHTISIVSEDGAVSGAFTLVSDNEPVNPDPVDPDPDDPQPVDPVVPVNPDPVVPDPADSGSNAGENAGSNAGTSQGAQTSQTPVSGGSTAAGGGTSSIVTPGADDQPSKAYSFLSGANATHEIGSGKELTVRADGDLEDFVAVLVDDEELDGAHYTTRSGSTIVAIAPEYLDTLPSGQHKLTVRFKDGETTTHFTVRDGSEDVGESAGPAEDEPASEGVRPVRTQAKQPQDSEGGAPDTGDGDMAALLLLMIACVLGFCGVRKSTSL